MIQTDGVPFVDLAPQWRQIRDETLPDIEKLFEASAFCLGPWASAFESQVADYLGTAHAVAVSSGTAALHLATIAAGLRPGDKVLVPAHTFIGTVWGLLYQGCRPVFCNVEPETGTIDVADAERRLTADVKAIVPVHLYGQPADMGRVAAFAGRFGLTVIEDTAQAIGGRFGGRALGTIGRFGCFSFYPGKNLGAAGEGGLVVTDDAAAAAQLRILREHGQSERYIHAAIGFNYRMDGIQALVLGHKLRHLDLWTEQRRALAARYEETLSGLPLRLPQVVHGDHVFHLYVVRTARRDELRRFLDARCIQTGLHYPVPLHRQPCLAPWAADQPACPVADSFAAEGLSLPLYAGMTHAQQDRVVAALRAFFDRRGA